MFLLSTMAHRRQVPHSCACVGRKAAWGRAGLVRSQPRQLQVRRRRVQVRHGRAQPHGRAGGRRSAQQLQVVALRGVAAANLRPQISDRPDGKWCEQPSCQSHDTRQ